jgi:uncharacterized protein (DUF58 family)
LEVRRIGTDAAFAEEPFSFRWGLFRRSGASFALEVSEDHPGLEGTARVAYLAPGESLTVRADLVARRRGPYRLREVRVTTQFPFGLFAKSRLFEIPGTLLVHPRRVPPAAEREGGEMGAAGDSVSPRQMNGTGEVAGLTPLREGDDARRIHWARSAALGQVVRLEREREERRTFMLEIGEEGSVEQIDQACEQLYARARRLLAEGHEVGISTPRGRIHPASGSLHERRLLEALTLLGFEPGMEHG